MCMDTSIIRVLGSRVGKVEDIGMDAQGECFGEFVRIRVSVNISKPQKKKKKLIVLKQEGEEVFNCQLYTNGYRTSVFVVVALGTSSENVQIIKVNKKKICRLDHV